MILISINGLLITYSILVLIKIFESVCVLFDGVFVKLCNTIYIDKDNLSSFPHTKVIQPRLKASIGGNILYKSLPSNILIAKYHIS